MSDCAALNPDANEGEDDDASCSESDESICASDYHNGTSSARREEEGHAVDYDSAVKAIDDISSLALITTADQLDRLTPKGK
ncbi:hypothetical protein IWW38_005000, partial [Coemansia aciculifera]